MVEPANSVKVSGLSVKRRGKMLLGPLDMTFAATGLTLVLGPNGAGKTTLLKVLHGIDRITTGSVEWAMGEAEARQVQAYVFQRPIMLRRSVRDNLAYPLKLSGVPRAETLEKVDYWAEQIGLQDVLDDPAPRLSGGEKQKLALGRALIRTPKVLFLDEPCANLDGRSTREIETILRRANDAGTRIIMTTHDLGQARRLASDVVFLMNGKLHEAGPAPDIFQSPTTLEAAAFFKGDIVE